MGLVLTGLVTDGSHVDWAVTGGSICVRRPSLSIVSPGRFPEMHKAVTE